uniref:Zinc finger protein n=1 Tax=Sipha flava TaxID=143950 RepID=A0A2S2QDV7_9HEMI
MLNIIQNRFYSFRALQYPAMHCTTVNIIIVQVTTVRNNDRSNGTGIVIRRWLRCRFCSAKFKLATSLRVHNSLHDGTISQESPFPCRECGKTFRNISYLYAHCRIHWDDRPHVCGVCGSAFLHFSDLTVHRRKHTGHRPYECSVCGDSFSSAANRMVHMRIHTGHRPYVCRECGRSFNQSHVLVEHVRVHTGQRPYECGLCEWTFVSSSSLRKHSLRKHVI